MKTIGYVGRVTRRAALVLMAAAASAIRPARGAGDMTRRDVARDLDRIGRWVAAHAPQAGPMFRPGAAPEAVAIAERRLATTFPDELRALYAHADGQPDDAPAISDAFKLMSLAELVEAALFLDDVFPGGRNDGNPDHAPIDAAPGIRPMWWWKGWLPIFVNGGGDYYCLDLDPVPGGKIGQIVSFWHDETYRSLVAASLGDFLGAIADGLDDGTYELKDEMISERAR